MQFEWDLDKAELNIRKHGMSFETASRVFADPYALSEMDRIEGYEYRWQTIGLVEGALLLLVAHVDRTDGDEEVVRIISARRVQRAERRHYEQAR